MKKLPTLTVDLIDELKELYPDKSPRLADTDRMIWFKAGQASVVEHLVNRLETEGISFKFRSVLS